MKKRIIVAITCGLMMLVSIGAIVGLLATESSEIWVLKYTPGFSKEKLEKYVTEQNELHQEIYVADSEILALQKEIKNIENINPPSASQKELLYINKQMINNYEGIKAICKYQLSLNTIKNTFIVYIVYFIVSITFLIVFCSKLLDIKRK
jgi:hypothetical protein